jgi:hypothetical protein
MFRHDFIQGGHGAIVILISHTHKYHERVGMKYDAVYDYIKITVLGYISIVKKT